MSNSTEPDKVCHFVGPDLGPKGLQKLSADDKEITLKAPIMTAADDKFCDIITNLQKNKALCYMRIVCKQMILMKYHAL